jgi:predicted dehydrogenase
VPGKVRWGVLGAAKIAVDKVIPAMQGGDWSEVTALASRDDARARQAAAQLGIRRAYGSYEALLADPDIDAVYNPLPNHLHVPWSIRALEAGKHVLCEKPIGLSVAEAEALADAATRTGRLAQEAFMVRSHPQWVLALDLVSSGRIGALRSYAGCFSYFNTDPANIRHVPEWGGGGLWDIGCYLVHTSRLLFRAEPRRVVCLTERDPAFGVDRLASMILEYQEGQAIGTCGTQMVPYQRVQILGTTGRVEIEIPFNAPADRPCLVRVDDGRDVVGSGIETVTVPTCNQYRIQGDLFSRAVATGGPAPYPLDDTIANMRVVEALFKSAASGAWMEVGGA